MVPVIDTDNKPLMPCTEKRARLLMERGKAKPCYRKSIFCIKMLCEPSAREFQKVVVNSDPGSKREGYTVATAKAVVLNILTNTPNWIKDSMETRHNLRRSRRSRKTPYRKCRSNRKSYRNEHRISPSTKARWDAKINMIKSLKKILPITQVVIEDIAAATKPGKKKWNTSFSPLEVGKKYFDAEIRKLNLPLAKFKGYDTSEHRKMLGFSKTKKKLEDVWEAHCVDSHCLAEMFFKKNIEPYKGMYRINFLEFHRRQLHVQNFAKGGTRKSYGGTVSLGLSRGSVARYTGKSKKYNDKLYFVGGASKGMVSIHSIETGTRVSQSIKVSDLKVLHITKRRVQFLPCL